MKTFHFSAIEFLHNLINEYKRRYAGSEANPLYMPSEYSTLRIEVRVTVPEVLDSPDIEQRLEAVLKWHVNEMIHDVSRLADRIANGLPNNPETP